ncbi:glycosyltransferase family 4 protein [Sinomonas sp. JGH33]|uniref:Glycosyltransferase family 4 protein n=1 Tax=Sinomonas terricola TaxID=3110330 RepID=A0ABU5T148_9MICC|nr:glycosyltransferase family 4 protein [Sinomonas sp. JGH33]MEA5453388.1 glycosyltransferase family 4 protein [Sinomonas sp. JGH33]
MTAQSSAAGPVVLLLAARNVTAARTGRIAVLETAVRGLRRTGARVVTVAITAEPGPGEWLGCPVVRLRPPSLIRMGVAACASIVLRRTLNEALFDSARLRTRITEVAREHGAMTVVADGIRTWEAARSTGLPVIAHLDDLLSERYASTEFADGNNSLFGYFRSHIPSGLVRPLEAVVKRLLWLEARRARRRELAIAREAVVTALTGEAEARRLEASSGSRVMALPMAVEPREPGDPGNADPASAAFLGVLHYGPNIAALRFVRDELLPALRQRGIDLKVTVIGQGGPEQREEFLRSGLSFTGYVDDLSEALRGHRMFISPILSGTGVKTKVLDSLSVGLPVVATPLGIAGIPVEDGRSALVADSAEELADHVAALHADPELARTIGAAGRNVLIEHLSPATVDEGWHDALSEAMKAGQR